MSDKTNSDAPQQGALAQALQAAAASAPDSALTSQIAAAAIEPPADDVDREPTDADKAVDVKDDSTASKPAVGDDGLTDAQRASNAATLAKVAAPAPAAPATPAADAPAAPANVQQSPEASSVKINGGQPLDPALQEAIDNNPNNEVPETPAAIADAGVAGTNVNDTADAPAEYVEPTPAEGDAPAPAAEVPLATAPVPKGLVRPTTSLYSDPETGYTQPEWFYTLTPTGQALKQTFDNYMHNMRPRLPVTDADVARNQAVLARTFTSVINDLEGDDFQAVFSHILAMFHEHKDGVFHPIKVNRGADLIALVPEDRRLFQRMVNMFGLLGDPNGRANAFKQVDLHKTLSGNITEAGRQKVFSYFNV